MLPLLRSLFPSLCAGSCWCLAPHVMLEKRRKAAIRAFVDNDAEDIKVVLRKLKDEELAELWDDDGWHAIHWAVHHCNAEVVAHVPPRLSEL